ncbi:MAG: CBS domain-containing protein [Thaumarchaeota archaeon]|nr:CBS domain-containing protein [Nitrososphaerota archaeon]
MPKVKDVMTTKIVKVDYKASVKDAADIMNKEKTTGVVVMQNGKPIGMLTERSLLRKFVPLNRKPDAVSAGEMMGPLLKISADAETKEAAEKLVKNQLTRLGVFKNDKMVGWLTLTGLSRESTKKHLLDILHHRLEPEPIEILCPACRMGVLQKVMRGDGTVARWECNKCGHIE